MYNFTSLRFRLAVLESAWDDSFLTGTRNFSAQPTQVTFCGCLHFFFCTGFPCRTSLAARRVFRASVRDGCRGRRQVSGSSPPVFGSNYPPDLLSGTPPLLQLQPPSSSRAGRVPQAGGANRPHLHPTDRRAASPASASLLHHAAAWATAQPQSAVKYNSFSFEMQDVVVFACLQFFIHWLICEIYIKDVIDDRVCWASHWFSSLHALHVCNFSGGFRTAVNYI